MAKNDDGRQILSEWQPIVGAVHNLTPTYHLTSEFDQFIRIPDTIGVSAADNDRKWVLFLWMRLSRQ